MLVVSGCSNCAKGTLEVKMEVAEKQSKTSPVWFPWNGSKRWLLPSLTPILREWPGRGKYVEPFVGSGAVSRFMRDTFPRSQQVVGEINPWLVSAYQAQIERMALPENYLDIDYWRSLTDSDIPRLTTQEQASRFAVCLFTAWGNRWKSRDDGSMGSENPINPKFTDPAKLEAQLRKFFSVRWLDDKDKIVNSDWKNIVLCASPGDLVYLDPPYPESLGYGNHWWSFSDHLDVVDWVASAVQNDVSVVVSNMATIERLFSRSGLQTRIFPGPARTKTRTVRSEVVAWSMDVARY